MEQTTAPSLDDLLTVAEAASYLKVPVSWVYQRTRTGAIPVRKLGGLVRIPRDEFLEWIEEKAAAGGRVGNSE